MATCVRACVCAGLLIVAVAAVLLVQKEYGHIRQGLCNVANVFAVDTIWNSLVDKWFYLPAIATLKQTKTLKKQTKKSNRDRWFRSNKDKSQRKTDILQKQKKNKIREDMPVKFDIDISIVIDIQR